jgi:hypothetical protein
MDNPTLISANDRYIQAVYVEGHAVYNFDFPVYDAASVQLFVNNVLWKFTEDYAVTVETNAGGFITLLKFPEDGSILTMVGATPLVRTEHYVPPTVDVTPLNVEMDKTMFRLQQIDRDILGCLQNRRDETEVANTLLPKTLDRSGKFAVWGNETGRLTYAGDPDEGGDDPTADYAKTYNNLADLTDPAAARENLGIIQGHVINALPQRPNLTISGPGVSVTNAANGTNVNIAQMVHSFSDLSGIVSVSQGGTGANNAAEARQNLGLQLVASTGSFTDLTNRPQIISNIVSTGTGVSLVGTTINGIAAFLSLVSDGTLKIRRIIGESAVELSVKFVPVGLLTGILSPDKGGTGLDSYALAAAAAGTVLTVTANHTFELLPPPVDRGHEILCGQFPLPQRRRLRFEGRGLEGVDEPSSSTTVISINETGTPGRYFIYTFSSDEFIGNTLTVDQAAIPFPIADPLLFVRDGLGNYVETGISTVNGSFIKLTAKPFGGKLIICEPGGGGFGLFHTRPFTAEEFSGNSLVILQDELPFALVDPMVATVDASGTYVNCAVAVQNHTSLTITAKPFSGKVLLFRGDLIQVYGRHRIIAPSGKILPDRLRLQFTGPGVQSVTDDPAGGKTVVNLSGGGSGGGKLAAVDFTVDAFTGTTLTISPQMIPFSYETPIVQVTDLLGKYGIAAVTVDPDTRDIIVEGEPFDGRIILMSN